MSFFICVTEGYKKGGMGRDDGLIIFRGEGDTDNYGMFF